MQGIKITLIIQCHTTKNQEQVASLVIYQIYKEELMLILLKILKGFEREENFEFSS